MTKRKNSYIMLLQCLSIFLIISGHYCDREQPLVKTPLGSIRGQLKTSENGRKFAAFEGIPYAKPPIGDLRFEEPEPIEPWSGTWNANFLTVCAQTDMLQPSTILGDEDCLYVNVYVPHENPNPDEKLEVVVHVHGGAYMYGSGNAYSPPEMVMNKDFIFVTFNYRVGILGFLSTEDKVVPGNNGLKDQALALKWVKENIASFGGNKDSITLMGLSAGGSSVHFHYFSDLSKNLFNRGFSQSGLALNPWSIAEEPLSKAQKLANAVGCPTGSSESLVNCLKQRPSKQILDKMVQFFTFKFLPAVPFGPVVEKGGSKPFLKAQPYDLLRQGQVQDVPFLASVDSHEGLFPTFLFTDDDLDYINENWNDLAPTILDFNYTLPQSLWKSTSEKIRLNYFGKDKINRENFSKLVQVYSDRYFLADTEITIPLQAKATKSPIYFFIFGYPGENNNMKMTSHGAEIRYMYGKEIFGPDPLTPKDRQMTDILWDMVISYAKTGKPTFGGVEWAPARDDALTCVEVTGVEPEDIKLRTTKELTNRAFWTGLRFSENENLFTTKDEL